MSLTVGELQVLLSGDPSKLNRELDRIDNRAGQTEKTHSAAWGRIGAAAGAAIRSGMIVATGAVVGLGAAIKQGLNMASFTEQAEISFGTLLGSADAAKTYLVDLQKFAAATPFELPGVVEGAQKLLGVGHAAEKVIPTLTSWGDASGALGLNQEKFGRVLTAVTQMMGKGKVSAEEMLQITEAGIPIWMLLAKATGKPVPELQKLASEGKLLAEDVLPALEAQMNADYGGSMAKQAGTLSGMWSTSKDDMNLALRDGVLPLSEGLKTVLPGASAAAATAIRELGLRGSEGLVNLIKRGQELRVEFGPELAELGEIAAQKWGQFTDLLGELGSAVAPSLPSLIDSLLRIAQVGGEVAEAMMPALLAGMQLAGPVADALAGALGTVATVLEAIAPALPVVVAGFLAFKGVSAVNGLLTTMAGSVGKASTSLADAAINAGVFTERWTGSATAGERVMSSVGRASDAVSSLGRVLPVVGLALLAYGANAEESKREIDEWAQTLLDGGSAATELADKVERQANAGFWERFKQAFTLDDEHNIAEDFDAAGKAADDLYDAMNPLQQKQQDVTTATNNLLEAQDRYGVTSHQAAGAGRVLESAQRALEQKQRDLANATQTATDKLLAQTQAAMAGANADLALSMANTQLTTAMGTYNEALATAVPGTTAHQQATDAMTGSAYSAAQAAAAQALAHSTAATAEGKQAEADAALLSSLQTTAQQLGSNTPAAISSLIASLQKSAGTANTTSAEMRDLGISVTSIPGSKDVIVRAPTEDQRRRLSDLGYTVTNIPGTKDVTIRANTDAAQTALNNFVAQQRSMTINVRAAMPDLPGTSQRMGTYGAIGGIVHAYANGGFEPMRGGIAQVVPPNSFRLIGDRVRDDEAYIPINQDKRSLEILALTAKRMGGAFVPNAGRGGVAGGSTGTGSASVGGVTHKHYHLNAAVRQEITPREFVALQREADALYG